MEDRLYKIFKYIGEFSIYGLLFYLPISNALIEVCFVLAFLSFIGKKSIQPDFRFLKFWPNLFLLAFFIFCSLSIINSGQYFHKSLLALIAKWLKYIMVCILVQDVASEKKVLKRSVMVFLFSASLVVLSGLTQGLIGFEFLRNRSIYVLANGAKAITSSFSHYNGLGAYLVVTIPLILSLFISQKEVYKFRSISLFVLIILSTVTLTLTFSRGSWFSFLSALALMCVLSGGNKKILLIFVIFILLLVIPEYQNRLFSVFKIGGDADRLIYWKATIRMIGENPYLGKGIGTFMDYFVRYIPDKHPAYAHNCYLQIWVETGIFSLLSFILFIASVIYFGIKKFLAAKDFLLLGLICGLTGFLVHIIFDVSLYSLRLAVLFWVWIGLISACISQKEAA